MSAALAILPDMSTASGQAQHYAVIRTRLMRLPPPAPKLRVALPPPRVEPEAVILEMHYCPLNMLAESNWRFLVALAAVRGGVSPRDILSRNKSRVVASARHEAAYLMHEHLGWSLPQIGRKLGGRDHTTILHSISVQRNKLETPGHD